MLLNPLITPTSIQVPKVLELSYKLCVVPMTLIMPLILSIDLPHHCNNY